MTNDEAVLLTIQNNETVIVSIRIIEEADMNDEFDTYFFISGPKKDLDEYECSVHQSVLEFPTELLEHLNQFIEPGEELGLVLKEELIEV